MAAILVGLNAASYTKKEKKPDSEFLPNRSTFNAGATGTQALYSLLSETGRRVVRWQKPPAALLDANANTPAVFVVTGAVRRPFTEPEIEDLLRWVSDGGRLVLIDRYPPEGLVTTTANWKIAFEGSENAESIPVDPVDQKQMISETAAVKPVQPTAFTQSVNAVQPSRFAASIVFERHRDKSSPGSEASPDDGQPMADDNVESPSEVAPIVHFGSGDKGLVVEAPYGNGRIIYLGDPYMVSNGGISLVDNAQLAINLVAADGKIVAFDEYHQGYGEDGNRLLQFFAGTPVAAIFMQGALLIGLVFFSQSRRFARPVPEAEPDRLSKLEYVSAMAELQGRTKAYDLAIENIYTEFRRRVTRYLGVDNHTAQTSEIASLLAERGGLDRSKVAETMHQCEEIIRGEPTNKKEVLHLAEALRLIEQKLGLVRTGRTRG